MVLKLSQSLTLNNCRKIASLNPHSVAAKYFSTDENFLLNSVLDAALYTLSSLEATRFISPWRVDYLELLLHEIDRQDLVPIVADYRQNEGKTNFCTSTYHEHCKSTGLTTRPNTSMSSQESTDSENDYHLGTGDSGISEWEGMHCNSVNIICT